MKARGAQLREAFAGKSVVIIVPQPRFDATRKLNKTEITLLFRQYQAALVSSQQKWRTLDAIGLNVRTIHRHPETKQIQFAVTLTQAVEAKDTVGVIVQRPLPEAWTKELHRIPPSVDIDPSHRTPDFSGPVTAEAITRLVLSFVAAADTISVVGGAGFIGSGVVRSLIENQLDVCIVEKGDDLTQIRNTNIVVACTGVPDLLNEKHLSPNHKLVVSASFIPQENTRPKTDVDLRASLIPQAITPVPGGIGPLEMATLIERVAHTSKVNIKKWDYKRDSLPFGPR